MKKAIGISAAVFAVLFVYHLGVCVFAFNQGTIEQGKVSINPLTNFISIKVITPKTDDNPWAQLGSNLGKGFVSMVGPALIEKGCNDKARKYLDLYAIVLPFRAEISFEDAKGK